MAGNFSRQAELYEPNERQDRALVIGAGATGSWVSLLLAKLGIEEIKIADYDVVELHNLPNQFYTEEQCGKYKVAALKNNLLQHSNSELTTIDTNHNTVGMGADDYTPELCVYDVVFCLVDSMKARTEIFNMARSQDCKCFIETRMGLTGYRVYMIDCTDEEQVAQYEKTLYSDEEAEVSACGTSQSIASTAMQCASHAVGLWLAKINRAEYIPNEVLVDVHSSLLLSKQFKAKE